MATRLQIHTQRWKNCERCELCNERKKVVLVRRSLPCHILFVGEAPGNSEDVVGIPFVGPAGKLLDSIIEQATEDYEEVKIAFTNLVACIPKFEGSKVHEPDEEYIKECSERLLEILDISDTDSIVMVGRLAEKWVPKFVDLDDYEMYSITHPAAILRANVVQRDMSIRRSVATIKTALENL